MSLPFGRNDLLLFSTVRGKLILQLHGNEFFHRTVSTFLYQSSGEMST